jgi:hypothetical protein
MVLCLNSYIKTRDLMLMRQTEATTERVTNLYNHSIVFYLSNIEKIKHYTYIALYDYRGADQLVVVLY